MTYIPPAAPPLMARNSQDWSNWVGKKGVVILVTTIHASDDAHAVYTPYQLAVVRFSSAPQISSAPQTTSAPASATFNQFDRTFMVANGSHVATGDTVLCSLRKIAQPSSQGVIEYGIKVVRYES